MQRMESVLDYVTKSLDEKRKTVYACDATSQEQLYTIAQTAAKMQENSTSVLLCGSAGLAREVPRAFSLRSSTLQQRPSSQNASARSASSNSILIVQGSRHSVTERQIGHLLKTERSVLSVELDPVKGLLNVPDSTQKPAVILLLLKVETREEVLDTLVQAARTVFDAFQPSGMQRNCTETTSYQCVFMH
ncbi:uncharacterized protein [Oscarella lobularis]|uniref:uncharacterized protein n=1 Tax=Oscarella lobularis TaxID=121494 RepID=UPI0033131862